MCEMSAISTLGLSGATSPRNVFGAHCGAWNRNQFASESAARSETLNIRIRRICQRLFLILTWGGHIWVRHYWVLTMTRSSRNLSSCSNVINCWTFGTLSVEVSVSLSLVFVNDFSLVVVIGVTETPISVSLPARNRF